MESGPPPPEGSVGPHTDTPPMRPRADSGSSTSIESTRSVRTLTSDDVEYVHENDRTYGNETFYLPCVYMPNNDFREQDRLSLQHQIFVQALQGKLTTARLLPSTRRILDLGTGPGHWAIAMAQQYPQAEVVGIDMTEWDLNTTEATLGESRVTWELDDLDVWGRDVDIDALTASLSQYDFTTDTAFRHPLDSRTSPSTDSLTADLSTLLPHPEPGWHFSDTFDLIHLRNMKGAFAHWEEVYAEIYKSLAPGGWIEIADYDLTQTVLLSSDHDTRGMPTFRKIYVAVMEASFKSGRPLGTYFMHPSYLEEAGFTDVQTTYVNVPIGQWPKDEAQRSLGKLMLVVVMETFEPSILRMLTKYGDKERIWTAEEVREAVVQAQLELAEWCAKAEKGEVDGGCASFKWITGRKSWHA